MLMKLLAEARFLRERARADYLDAERDLFERFGKTAARHLTDDDRRLLLDWVPRFAGSACGESPTWPQSGPSEPGSVT